MELYDLRVTVDSIGALGMRPVRGRLHRADRQLAVAPARRPPLLPLRARRGAAAAAGQAAAAARVGLAGTRVTGGLPRPRRAADHANHPHRPAVDALVRSQLTMTEI